MNFSFLTSSFVLFLLSLTTCVQADSKELFDGHSLQGWECDEEYWRVQDGAIVGEIAPGTQLQKNTWLVWRGGEVADFELRFQFKLSGAAGANSGVQFRCQVENVDHVSGYQADLDMGDVWLGRVYDEHGRALLVERGSRVHFAEDGQRASTVFAPPQQYKVLFRENAWNDYRVVAVGDRVDVYVNGTLFSQLKDEQTGARDLVGALAFQLHSGGETKVEFRNIQLEDLDPAAATRLAKFAIAATLEPQSDVSQVGYAPISADGTPLDLGFESGSLEHWTVDGAAFEGQPTQHDSISARWSEQVSNKVGEYFIGGFELGGDAPVGTLTSQAFVAERPYASFLIGGGNTAATRVEIATVDRAGKLEPVFTASGDNREQMRRVVADLRSLQGATLAVRVIDESSGGWGHLNFDDFRLHDAPPVAIEPSGQWRSTFNPVLQHLVENPATPTQDSPANSTMGQMYVPEGFSVEVIAAEPDIHQPIAFAFDTKGRLWVVEGHSYPQKRPEGEGLDRVVIFTDSNADGRFDQRQVFIEGLNLVSGIEVGYGGVWIGAAPQLLFIPDRNGDDVPDAAPEVLLDGFGYGDTHETLNSFMWGPDGWLYGNQGVFNSSLIGRPGMADAVREKMSAGVWRYHPVQHKFEVFAHGGSNQWGLDYDEHGQIFMTHCRSYWGQGPTSHVMRNGHYWNQVNGGYAPFISSTALPDMPYMKNYLLASARYGHGEGGAGKVGSREVYGGHSHVGTLLYLGDNWPAEYRNHLFTLNLHGHQINHQVNERVAGGYNTVHAGADVLFCSDQQFIGVDLQVGPDGAVYISDWYDPRHCHNPNTELWDRGNGRMYRMKYDAGYQPLVVDYANASAATLVEAQKHTNHWHARAARMVLAERAAAGMLEEETKQQLLALTTSGNVVHRLHGLWALQMAGFADATLIGRLLKDDSEYVRGWAVQVGCEVLQPAEFGPMLRNLAANEKSLFVSRYLASALLDLSADDAWSVAASLLGNDQIETDRDLPHLLWQCLAPRIDEDLQRGLALARQTDSKTMQDSIFWYAARRSPAGREALAKRLSQASTLEQQRLLNLLAHALRGMRNIPAPAAWSEMASGFYQSENSQMRGAAEQIGAALGDVRLFSHMREIAADPSADIHQRLSAVDLLAADRSPQNLEILLQLVADERLAAKALPVLANYDDQRIATTVLKHLVSWSAETRDAAMELLASRPERAEMLLDEIASGNVEKSQLTAYFANQMANLGSQHLNERLANEWGRLGASSSELREEIQKTLAAYQTAPLWAYSESDGAQHFQKLCAACHLPNASNSRIAPKLEGTHSKGIAYAIENVIDPNAVIGLDFQARIVLTDNGQVITGLIESQTDTAVTVKTATSTVTIDKDSIEETRVSDNSFMPSGLLNTLNDRERIELFKYLMSL